MGGRLEAGKMQTSGQIRDSIGNAIEQKSMAFM